MLYSIKPSLPPKFITADAMHEVIGKINRLLQPKGISSMLSPLTIVSNAAKLDITFYLYSLESILKYTKIINLSLAVLVLERYHILHLTLLDYTILYLWSLEEL